MEDIELIGEKVVLTIPSSLVRAARDVWGGIGNGHGICSKYVDGAFASALQ
jgi:hypothetical protein